MLGSTVKRECRVRLHLAIEQTLFSIHLSTGTELIWGDEMNTKQEMKQISVRVRTCACVFGISCSHSNLVTSARVCIGFESRWQNFDLKTVEPPW